MKHTNRRFLLFAIAAFLGLFVASSTFATNVSMVLTSAGSTLTGTNVLDSVYVGAYTATINGVSTPVICDDYVDESFIPESWTANSSTFSDLSSTLWATENNYSTLYDQAAWLIEQMVNPTNASQLGEIHYAIWGVFDSSAITNLTNYSASDGVIAQGWLSNAQGQTFTPGEFSNFTVYTPAIPPAPSCGGSPCPSSPPQEFMVYNASEPSLLVILGVDLLLFGFAIAVLRRRGILVAVR